MTVTYTGLGKRPIGTIKCDQCGTTWSDGIAETDWEGQIRVRAYQKAGWDSYQPNGYQQEDRCPDCKVTSAIRSR
jgi:hypothetical protein